MSVPVNVGTAGYRVTYKARLYVRVPYYPSQNVTGTASLDTSLHTSEKFALC